MSVLLSFDQNNYNRQSANLSKAAAYLQTAVTAYNGLNLPALTTADFYSICSDPIDLIFDKMTGGNPVLIGGLSVDKTNAINILAKPQGYDALLAILTGLPDYFMKNLIIALNPSIIPTAFELDGNGNVIIIPAYDQALQESNKRYATSDKAIALYNLANSIVDQLTTGNLLQSAITYPNGFGRFIGELFESRYGQQPTINAKAILPFN